MSTNEYNKAFDTSFTFTPSRNLTRQQDDACEQQKRNEEDGTKLKYVTTNYIDLLNGHKQNWFGIALRDQLFTPAENMDGDSKLRYSPLTNCKVRNNFGQLPIPTLPALNNSRAQDTDIESMYMWPIHNREEKSCNPRDTQYYDRSFYVFPEMKHEAIKSVQTGSHLRQGISTRFLNLDMDQEEKRKKYSMTSLLRK